MRKESFIQVITTCPTKAVALKLAKILVDKKLAACVQVSGPIESVYRWQGKRATSREFLCFIKTKESLYKRIEDAIYAAHPYQVPEIIAFPITWGSENYLRWLQKETISR